jgi:hypothetical protein
MRGARRKRCIASNAVTSTGVAGEATGTCRARERGQDQGIVDPVDSHGRRTSDRRSSAKQPFNVAIRRWPCRAAHDART